MAQSAVLQPVGAGAAASADALLRATGLTKAYRKGPRVLDGLSLELKAGCVMGLVGPNGAGKTTLLSILAGFLPPSAGSIELCGEALAVDLHPEARRHLGIVLNGAGLVDELRPVEYLDLWASLCGLDGTPYIERALDYAERLALTPHLRSLIRDLSTGTRKKVQLVAALLHEPEVLLLDEPFESLDPPAVQQLSRLVKEYVESHGAAAIVSSHILPYVRPLATEIRFLWGGRLLDEGELAPLLSGAGSDPALAGWAGVLGE